MRTYLVFHSTTETLRVEQILAQAGLTCRVVQKPAGIRLDCGLAVRIAPDAREQAEAVLKQAGITPRGVYELAGAK